ncbi:MAG: glutaredoxin family protein [Thermoanaerobaculia bacterium]|nr:glutaredoxin family protein [Thermoanaerobaculia bacterium]
MSKKQTTHLPRLVLLCTLLTAPLAVLASADWLVTLEGQVIETKGPWTIAERVLTYTALDGTSHTLPLGEVDLEGSAATTAFKQGQPYTPPPKAVVAAAEREEGEPKIILYQTSWCGYCRKARQLLDELGAEYVAKDIEKDDKAALEYRDKGKGYRGIPLLDFDGEIVQGYNEFYIRRHVEKIKTAAEP